MAATMASKASWAADWVRISAPGRSASAASWHLGEIRGRETAQGLHPGVKPLPRQIDVPAAPIPHRPGPGPCGPRCPGLPGSRSSFPARPGKRPCGPNIHRRFRNSFPRTRWRTSPCSARRHMPRPRRCPKRPAPDPGRSDGRNFPPPSERRTRPHPASWPKTPGWTD